MSLKKIFIWVIVWQVAVVLVTFLSNNFLPLKGTFLNPSTPIYLTNPLLYSRGNFDGIHYTEIAAKDYTFPQQAFFPFYPLLIRNLNNLIHNQVLSGTIVSLVCFVLMLVFFTKLIRLDYSESVSKWSILVLLFFPTSFYFGFVYTESVFLLLVVLTFYLVRKNHWLLAGLAGALACYTRFVGILLLPALLIEWWKNKKIGNLLCLLIIPLGLLNYMWYLRQTTGDYLAFYHAQSYFGQGRTSDKLVLIYQVVWRYIKMIATVDRANPIYPTIVLELITGIVFLAASIIGLFRQRLSYAVFAASAYLVPTFTGSFTSIPRYVLVCFPVFILIGKFLEKNKYRYLWLSLLGMGQAIFLTLFVRGYWVG